MTGRGRHVVVGAGMAGLTAARLLGEGPDAPTVTVLDKGRGVGGRMATRRIGPAVLDHGAQFLTTHSEEFAAAVEDWRRAGAVERWHTGQVGPAGAGGDGHWRYRGAPAMTGIAKHLATGLDVRTGVRVTAVSGDGARWRVRTTDGDLAADALLLTAPVPQIIDLLGAGDVRLEPAAAQAVSRVRYDPCIAVLAVLDGPAGLPDPGAVAPADGPVGWCADNQTKGISPVPAVTVHAGGDASRDLWDAPDDEVAEHLLDAVGLAARALPGQVQVQRWRYARPTVLHPDRCLASATQDGGAPLVLAGDAFGGAKVEGAHLSGRAAAGALRDLLGA